VQYTKIKKLAFLRALKGNLASMPDDIFVFVLEAIKKDPIRF